MNDPRIKRLILFLALPAAVLLGACAKKPVATSDLDVIQSVAPAVTPSPVPSPTPVPLVDIGGTNVSADTESLDLTRFEFIPDVLCENSRYFRGVKEIRLGPTELEMWEIERIRDSFPEAEVLWETELLGEVLPSDTALLDLSKLTEEDLDTVLALLPRFPNVRVVGMIPESGITQLSPETVGRIRQELPNAEFHCCWELYGQLASWKTTELRYSKQKLGNKAIAAFRAVLPYLNSLELLRFYDCGITDYDAMVALKNDFPSVNIVFSVVIAGYNFMTDTILFHCPLLRDKHTELLKYFPDILYLDVGHNRYLTNVNFIKYLPKLQVVILSITKIKDISVLAGCPDLEYVELLNTYIEDLSPLSGLEKIEYLNIGDMPYVKDISPIFGLTSLKMVRICMRTFDHVKKSQVEELKAALPECFVSDGAGDPTTSGYWRFADKNHTYTERYALLRQQMLYDVSKWEDRQQNSPTRLEGDRER